MSDPILSSAVGNNDDLMALVAKMYLKAGDVLADVTYGKGVFWKKIDLSQFSFFPSDIITCENKYDFRELPYADATFDSVVFDPPYCHNPGRMIVEKNYRNAETTKGMYHKDIINLYKEGMTEAKRILKNPGGLLWVKCKDEIESSYQRWSHFEIYEIARNLGFFAKDLFILTQLMRPIVQYKNQQHARKNHSYLWIFKLPFPQELVELKRFNLLFDADISLKERKNED